jgi:single-strand DNA-binding protein
MTGYSKSTIIGNVGRDAEMRFTPSGAAVTEFSVAVGSKRGDEETTTWFNVTAWNKLAETCNQYVHKGMKVFVEGRIEIQEWESEGGKRSKVVIVASTVLFLDKGGG